MKHSHSGSPHERHVFVLGTNLYWVSKKGDRGEDSRCINLAKIAIPTKCIVSGMKTESFNRINQDKPLLAENCFSVIGDNGTLDLEAGDKLQRDLWVRYLRKEVLRFQKEKGKKKKYRLRGRSSETAKAHRG
eukprot:TRINITY_DN5458_c0_g1_i1.p1 TRINITY_DN5458_c0_g1~~TRINITY_DN5458_c0_g1_i1.p1  ORF type:complete len:132 (+),score=36.59 TRINITY_DN5458_c0_g1_i1:219-614(+)